MCSFWQSIKRRLKQGMVFKQSISFHRIFHTITLALDKFRIPENAAADRLNNKYVCIIFAMENSRADTLYICIAFIPEQTIKPLLSVHHLMYASIG